MSSVKKRILFLIPNLKHGGAEKVLVNLVNNLSSSKYEITIQTLFDEGVHRDSIKSHIKYIPGLAKSFRGNVTLAKLFSPEFLWRKLIKCDYDIVISYLEGSTNRIVAGCQSKNIKKIAWIHTEFVTTKLASLGYRNTREAEKYYNKYDQIVTVSNRIKFSLGNVLNLKTPISVLYNTNETEDIIRMSELIPNDDRLIFDKSINICTVGRLSKVKGIDRLLCAHKRLLDEGYNSRVYIIGTGTEQQQLEELIHNLGIEEHVFFLGFQSNPYQYLSKCDLYVCSSIREGFSTAVTEALLVGTPVVSTDCSGAKELLGENNEYGLVVENSAEGIYKGMKEMLTNSELLAYYKKQAKIRGSYFSREKTVQAVEEMLDSL